MYMIMMDKTVGSVLLKSFLSSDVLIKQEATLRVPVART